MLEFNHEENQFRLIVAIGLDDITEFKRGILGILREVDMEGCSPTLPDDILRVHRFLEKFGPHDDHVPLID